LCAGRASNDRGCPGRGLVPAPQVLRSATALDVAVHFEKVVAGFSRYLYGRFELDMSTRLALP